MVHWVCGIAQAPSISVWHQAKLNRGLTRIRVTSSACIEREQADGKCVGLLDQVIWCTKQYKNGQTYRSRNINMYNTCTWLHIYLNPGHISTFAQQMCENTEINLIINITQCIAWNRYKLGPFIKGGTTRAFVSFYKFSFLSSLKCLSRWAQCRWQIWLKENSPNLDNDC